MKVDAVFEGGGVKGIGLVGAVTRVEEAGYQFENLAGTSAGAIVAALLAVGYTGREIGEILKQLDYNRFKDEGKLDRLGLPGKLLSVLFEYGIYEGDFFERWLEGLLAEKGKRVFGDIRTEYPEWNYRYKFQAVASDLTDHKLLVLPFDLEENFGINPDSFSISRAVRMSMSIPLFFEPVKLKDRDGNTHLIVDGGILSNYPIWLLDDGSDEPPWPTFGFKLTEPDKRKLKPGQRQPRLNLIEYLKALVQTMMDAHDSYHISKDHGDYERTIAIPVTVDIDGRQKEIKTTDFSISAEESGALFQNGVDAAEEFLKTWNFPAWTKKYRK